MDTELPEKYQPYGKDRFDRDVSQFPREAAERCSSVFMWWWDPYGLRECTRNDRLVFQPSARYYGFIDADT